MKKPIVYVFLLFISIPWDIVGASETGRQITLTAQQGRYQGTLTPLSTPPPIGKFHTWILQLRSMDGEFFLPSLLQITGGMPEHGHGLPSQPQATRFLGDGQFEIAGLIFNMAGTWQVNVTVNGPLGLDILTAEFDVAPSHPPSQASQASEWTRQETGTMASLVLSQLTPPGDPSNRFLGNHTAQELGKALFNDPNLSANKDITCATCHDPNRQFTDGRERSVGSKTLARHAPTVVASAHAPWLYWDGRRDSLWSQALVPIETSGEMDNNRTDVVRYVTEQRRYASKLAELLQMSALKSLSNLDFPAGAGPFAQAPHNQRWQAMNASDQHYINQVFAAIGKSIAAYETTLNFEPGLFDEFVAGLDTNEPSKTRLSTAQVAGLKLFLNPEKTQCLRCHNGPLFTNQGFHNIGTGPALDGSYDFGRMFGFQAAQYDQFNCLSDYSDARTDQCQHVKFALTQQSNSTSGAFKVPTLRGISDTAPYFHDGRFATLIEVMKFYREPPTKQETGHELPTLDLTDGDIKNLVEFLKIL